MKHIVALALIVFLGTSLAGSTKKQQFQRAILMSYSNSELKMICLSSGKAPVLYCAWASNWYLDADWKTCVAGKENNQEFVVCEPGI